MNVVVIQGMADAELLGVAKDLPSAVNFLVETGYLSRDTQYWAKKFEWNVSIGVYFGASWLEVVRGWDIEQFNVELANLFYLSVHEVAGV